MGNEVLMKNISPLLKGSTIILRKPRESDMSDRIKIGKSKEFIHMCGGDTRNIKPSDQKSVEIWYKLISSRELEWVIEYTKKCIGIARLTVNKSDYSARYAIGIFDDNLYGKGIGTQVTKLVLEYAFNTLDLHRIELKVLEYNKRAISCYEKCGFKIEGILRDSAYIEDNFETDIMMSILDYEYMNNCNNLI